jgi:hypothetical protein
MDDAIDAVIQCRYGDESQTRLPWTRDDTGSGA